ncbi:hypothetical protein IFR04_008777 [Cadophora malorum]|uniref:Uncharacterized protein n=1 Tax=Cadophora malorum TaxID=108018 RepID=A0A8H7TFV6_9HELO|nr:hypothetical protein IFR04_008777 [Cadophora malorum]
MGLVQASIILTGVMASIDNTYDAALDTIISIVDIFTTITASIGFTIPFEHDFPSRYGLAVGI